MIAPFNTDPWGLGLDVTRILLFHRLSSSISQDKLFQDFKALVLQQALEEESHE